MAASVHPNLTNFHPSTRSSTTAREWISRTIATWRTRIDERRAFANLEYRDLRDMGLSRWEVDRERAKPFWRG
jgi:uncharacterized protein YjiS (DUF1127 family)